MRFPSAVASAVLVAAVIVRLGAQSAPASCDLVGYRAQPGLTAERSAGGVIVSWSGDAGSTVVFGEVVGVYIDDAFISDGRVDTGAMRPLARLGYMDYSVVTPESMFTMNRPIASDDGQGASLVPGPWDGTYR